LRPALAEQRRLSRSLPARDAAPEPRPPGARARRPRALGPRRRGRGLGRPRRVGVARRTRRQARGRPAGCGGPVIETGLSGKRALVAGGASGIGRAIVLALEGEGAEVAVVDRNEADVGVVRLRAELGEPESSELAVARATEELGGLDLAVYTA